MVEKVKLALKDVFYPESIAVIGASSDEEKEKRGWTGNLLNFGYKGRLYPVNPKGTQVLGLKIYSSVTAIEEPVDYAILNVSAPLVPRLLRECAAKEVKIAHVFTAGFAETGKPEGKSLQEEVKNIVEETGIRLSGPNCLGVHCPDSGVTFANLPKRSGPAGLISQTGAGVGRIVMYGSNRGIFFGKAVSYGNAVDLDSTDYLEMLVGDDQTQFIALYLEGVKDGRRFFNLAMRCLSLGKPLVMLKAGLTEAGREATRSHTGSLAGSEQAWEAFFAQTGAIRVYSLEEIVDQLVALEYLKPRPNGGKVAIIGRGGGPGVVATDMCEKVGLKVPPFSPDTRAKLERITTEAGSMARNPIEVGVGRAGAQQGYMDAFRIVADSPEIDIILTHVNPEAFVIYGGSPDWINYSIDALLDIFKTVPKPIALVLTSGETPEGREIVLKAWQRCADAGLTVFRSYENAARVISRAVNYYEFRDRFVNYKD